MSATEKRTGYLYVLAHPDLPGYYKLGQTTKHPEKRLKTHNSQKERLLGKIVERTGKPWQLIYYVPVTDARRGESATLWYDVLPRWDNLELNAGSIIGAIEDLKSNLYLDQTRYAEMLETELLFYDYEAILKTLEREWSRDGLSETCEAMIKEMKVERRSKDKRRRQNPDGSWNDDEVAF
jgi:predicted GIY-YIG superfamily endonuclease